MQKDQDKTRMTGAGPRGEGVVSEQLQSLPQDQRQDAMEVLRRESRRAYKAKEAERKLTELRDTVRFDEDLLSKGEQFTAREMARLEANRVKLRLAEQAMAGLSGAAEEQEEIERFRIDVGQLDSEAEQRADAKERQLRLAAKKYGRSSAFSKQAQMQERPLNDYQAWEAERLEASGVRKPGTGAQQGASSGAGGTTS